MTLADLLGEAYRLHQVAGDRAAAIRSVKAALADNPELAAEATAEFRRLGPVVAAREMVGSHGCHVSRICFEILKAALAT